MTKDDIKFFCLVTSTALLLTIALNISRMIVSLHHIEAAITQENK